MSKLTIITQLFFCRVSRINPLVASAASITLFWGKNPYWFSYRRLLEKTWWLILLISSLSRTFPPTFNRIIGRYLVTSVLPSFPGLTMGIIIERFLCLGKYPFLRHSRVHHCSSRPLPVFCLDQTFLTPPVSPPLWIIHQVCQEVLLPVVWWIYDIHCRYSHCLQVWIIPSCVSLCLLCPSCRFHFGFWELTM